MIDIQGHRGARALFPENTLEGFLAAAALGVTAFELDVGMTQDGVVVVHHDLTLNPDIARDEAGQWIDVSGPAIASLTFDALQRYDVGRIRPGSKTATMFPDQAPHDGVRVPTLRTVLRALPDVRFTIEVKTDPTRPQLSAPPAALADAALAIIEAEGAAARVTMEAFDWRVQHHLRRVRPSMRLAWLTTDSTANATWWDRTPADSVPASVACQGGPIWAPDHRTLTRDHVQEAHQLGLSVLAWTVNDPDDMQRLIGWGVDGIISDRPDLALLVAAG